MLAEIYTHSFTHTHKLADLSSYCQDVTLEQLMVPLARWSIWFSGFSLHDMIIQTEIDVKANFANLIYRLTFLTAVVALISTLHLLLAAAGLWAKMSACKHI